MSTSYHTTNSLLHVKTQSEGMTFSPVWEPERSPGEQGAAALLNNTNQWMNACFSFSSETRPAFPPCTLNTPVHKGRLTESQKAGAASAKLTSVCLLTCGSHELIALLKRQEKKITD